MVHATRPDVSRRHRSVSLELWSAEGREGAPLGVVGALGLVGVSPTQLAVPRALVLMNTS